MSALVREYVGLWRDAFSERDWYDRLLARLIILSLHGALIFAALLLVAALR